MNTSPEISNPMITDSPVRESQHSETIAAAEQGDHIHPPTPVETWAEESPAYRAPVEFSADAEDDFWRANHHSQSYAGETAYGASVVLGRARIDYAYQPQTAIGSSVHLMGVHWTP